MVVGEPISKNVALDDKGECTRGVCIERSCCLEVACDGTDARCGVTLISEVYCRGLLVGVEAGNELLGSYEINKKQLAAAVWANRRALFSQKR